MTRSSGRGRYRKIGARVIRAVGSALLLLGAVFVPAQQQPSEYQVKAAFLYNFMKFVQWPDANDASPMVIGVVGNDPFGPLLDEAVRAKSINGRLVQIRRLKARENLHGCHILFISNSDRVDVSRILAALAGDHALTVGESDRFLRQGGMIALLMENDQVRLEINLPAAEDKGLKLSSKLLAVARVMGAPRSRGGGE